MDDADVSAAPATAVVGAQADAKKPDQQEKPSFVQLMMKLLVLYFSFTFFSRQFQASQVKEAVQAMKESEADEVSQGLKPLKPGEEKVSWYKEMMGVQSRKIPQFPEYDARGRQLLVHRCTFPKGQRMDLHVYMSDSEEQSDLWLGRGEMADGVKLLWRENDLVFAREDPATSTRTSSLTLDVPPVLRSNGSAWAHIYLTKKGMSPNPQDPNYHDGGVAYQAAQLNRHILKPKKKDVHYLVDNGNLAEGETGGADTGVEEEEEVAEGEMQNFWKPTLTLGQVDYTAVFQRNHIPATFAGHISFQESTGNYHPIVYVNEFWLQQKHLVAVNSTVESLDLELSFAPLSFWKFQTMSQLESQWDTQSKLGLGAEGDQDGLREMLAETNPIVLVITMIVSLLHSIFNFLAFKNDISFWKDKKRSLEGISVRSMLVNLFFQIVIFLYLADNDTTYMILVTNAIGLAIEVWKVGRFMVGRLDWGGQDGQPQRTIPRISLKAKETYRKSKTKEFDDIAAAHLFYLVAPLMVGYAAYSLLNQQHKGWYSWVLNSLVGFVYMFGFVMMTPQLFINYKLQSVAHMPWRVMSYKFINTFIDDLFAFVVPMPTMHRLACFRDDIVFFVFLYQRYLYKVDDTRRNEYGQSAKSAEDAEKIREAQSESIARVARVPRRSKFDKAR